MGLAQKCEDVLSILRQITVEPYLFFFIFGYGIRLVTFQDLLLRRSCSFTLGYSEEICADIENHDNELANAQKLSFDLYVGFVMVSTLPAVLVATLAGPWSDKYGRRIPMICATVGTTIDSIIVTIITSYPTVPPAFYLASGILSGLSGGYVMSLSSSYSYMSDITDESSRQSRFAILEFFFIIATPLGTVIGGQIFQKGAHIAVLAVSPVAFALAFLWATLVLKESKPLRHTTTGKQMLLDFFRLDNMKDSLKTCIMKRPGNIRMQLWLLIFAGCMMRLITLGSFSIGYHHAKKLYLWDVTTYSNAITIFQVCNGLVTLTLVPLMSKTLMIHEAVVGLIGILSLMSKSILLSIAEVETMFFYGWFAGLLQPCGSIAVRSRLSKLVSKKEQGRVFSLLATFEAFAPVLGTFIFSELYKGFVNIYVGIPFAFAAVLLIPPAIIFGWMMRMPTTVIAELPETEENNMKELKEVASGNLQ